MNVDKATKGVKSKMKEAGDGAADAVETASEKVEKVEDAAEDMAFDVGKVVDEHPVGTLLAALGVGYVVGGGLFTALTKRLVGAGLRLGLQFAVIPALERQLTGLAEEPSKDTDDAPHQHAGES